jgi:hypothetical protein
MRKLVSFAMAVLMMIAAIAAWSTAASHSKHRSEASAASGVTIDPFELMKHARDLAHPQYDTDP